MIILFVYFKLAKIVWNHVGQTIGIFLYVQTADDFLVKDDETIHEHVQNLSG